MSGDYVGPYLHLGNLRECRLEGGNELRLELIVYLAPAVCAFYITANICIEEQRVDDSIRIDTVASY